MDFKTKRHCKKRAKQFITWAYIFMSVGFVKLIISLFLQNIPIMLTGFALLLVSLFFGMVAEDYILRRRKYQKEIYISRQKYYFERIIKALKERDYKKAILINDKLLSHHQLSDYSYAIIITEMRLSGDESLALEGEKHLYSILNK